jgi:hypothetical protein
VLAELCIHQTIIESRIGVIMILPIRLVQVQVFLNKVSNQSQVLLRHCEGALVVDFLISVVNQLSLGILDELQVGFV